MGTQQPQPEPEDSAPWGVLAKLFGWIDTLIMWWAARKGKGDNGKS
jgi:hypothetical protein